MAYNTGSTLVNFIPEVWAAEFLEVLRASLVFGGPGIVNHNYEGEISAKGQTVHITTIGDPTVGDYTEHTDITIEKLADSFKELTITEAKYFGFEMDDIEAAQVLNGGAVMSEAARNAAYVLSHTADSFISTAMSTSVAAANQVGGVGAIYGATPVSVYEKVLLPLKLKLDQANIPPDSRWLVGSPDLEGALLLDDRFVNANKSGSTAPLLNGMIGRAAGFDIYTTTAVPSTAPATGTAGKQTILAGYPGAYTFANQIAKVESGRMEKRFADYMKGLHLYGGALLRPTGIASAVVDYAAAL